MSPALLFFCAIFSASLASPAPAASSEALDTPDCIGEPLKTGTPVVAEREDASKIAENIGKEPLNIEESSTPKTPLTSLNSTSVDTSVDTSGTSEHNSGTSEDNTDISQVSTEKTIVSLEESSLPVTADNILTTSDKPNSSQGEVEMEFLCVRGVVRHRYATMEVHGEMVNHGDVPKEARFVIHLPESAFISRAAMKVGNRTIEGLVRERAAAQQEYQQAVTSGQAAGHVATASVRDASTVRVSVNVAARAKASFNLTYEELLVRRNGRYELAIHLSPEQNAPKIKVELQIQESKNLTYLHVPPFGSTSVVDKNNKVEEENAQVRVERSDDGMSATLKYSADGVKRVATDLPLYIQYDVDHNSLGGEVLLLDGYFVHFLAPPAPELTPLPKHAIFVLDTSGSMWGRKLRQLQTAMTHILPTLRRTDFFSIVQFSSTATEWSIQGLQPAAGKGVYSASRRNIALAQDFVNRMQASGATNLAAALKRSLTLAARHRNATRQGLKASCRSDNCTSSENMGSSLQHGKDLPEPMIVFLTDGMPTVGELRLNRILTAVKLVNKVSQASIFTLAFGDGANRSFLRKLALQNHGFSRRIYEAADAALQLQNFYQEVATPLLTNLTFTYVESKVDLSAVTLRQFPTYFSGSELVVAGRLSPEAEESHMDLGSITARASGNSTITHNVTMSEDLHAINPAGEGITKKKRRPGHLERAWAFLTIRQLLDEAMLEQTGEEMTMNVTEEGELSPRQRAVALALQYGFVTPVTSLIMIDPNISANEDSDNQQPAVEVEGGPNEGVAHPEGYNIQDKVIPVVTPPPRLPGGASFILPPSRGPSVPGLSSSHPDKTGSLVDSAALTALHKALPWLAAHLMDGDKMFIPITQGDAAGDSVDRILLRQPSKKDEAMAGTACQIRPSNGTLSAATSSTSSTEEGTCQHLASCLHFSDLKNYSNFLHNFCDIRGMFVGVCCPSSLPPVAAK